MNRCVVCQEPVEQGPRAVDWIHTHGDIYCGTGDGAMALPESMCACPIGGATVAACPIHGGGR